MTDIYEKVATNLTDPGPINTELLARVDNANALTKYLSSRDLTLDNWRKLILGAYEADFNEMFQDITQHFIREEIDKKANSKPEDEEKRLTLINTIATYYLIQASRATEKSKRDELFGEVMKCTSKSDTINMLHSSLFVLKGYYLFYQGTFDQAVNYFDNGREYHPKRQCVTAYIGQACVEFCKKDNMKALKLLKSAFKLNPQVPSKLKVALGHCFFNLKKTKAAQRAFEYAIESDPNNAEAYFGLALVHKKRENYPGYFENLEKSFNIKKDNVPTVYELAEHYLFKEDFEKAKKLASNGLQLLTKSQTIVMEKAKLAALRIDYYELKSRLNYIIGNCYHHAQNYENAMKHYLHAVSSHSNNFVAQFTLGQMYLNDRNWQEALTCFEHILKNCQDTDVGECYRLLGYIYSRKLQKEEAIHFYEKAIKFDNQDYECMLEYASYLEGIDNEKSLNLYVNAVKVIRKLNLEAKENGQKEIQIHAETLLNIAVLRYKKGDVDDAQKELKFLLENGERLCEEAGAVDKFSSMKLTIMYNLAIILEEKGAILDAADLYNEIIEENPHYLDAYLRQSQILLKLGQSKKAEELCVRVLSKCETLYKSTKIDRFKSKPLDVMCQQGYILNETGEWNQALQIFSQIKQRFSIDDPYSKLAQAAVYYTMSLDLRNNTPDQKKYLKIMGEIAKNVLNTEESNFVAAMTLGVTLAEVNKLSEAKDVFNMIQESCQHNKSVILNNALLEILNGRFDLAIASFNNYLNRMCATSDPYTESSLALCYLMTKRYKEAKRVFQKLILRYPEDLSYRYNLCAVYYEEAFEILKQEQRQIENTKEGVKYLKLIKEQFDFMVSSSKSKLSRYMLETTNEKKKKKETEHERIRELSSDKSYWISTNFDTFMDRLKQDEENQRKKDQIQEESQRRRRDREERERKKAMEEEQRKMKERELEEKFRQIQKENAKIQEALKQEKEEKERKKEARKETGGGGGGRRRRKQDEETDNFIDNDDDAPPLYQDDDEEERDYGEEAVFHEREGDDEESELPSKLRRRKEEKTRRLSRLKNRKERKEEDDEGELPLYTIDEEEEVEPQPRKMRKLVKNTKRRIESEGEEEQKEETYSIGGNENEGNMEEEAGDEDKNEEPEEPPVDDDEGNYDEGLGKREENDEEEHYMF